MADFDGPGDGIGSPLDDGDSEGIGIDGVGFGVGEAGRVGVAVDVGVGLGVGLGEAPTCAGGGNFRIGWPASAASTKAFQMRAGTEPPVISLRPRMPCSGRL